MAPTMTYQDNPELLKDFKRLETLTDCAGGFAELHAWRTVVDGEVRVIEIQTRPNSQPPAIPAPAEYLGTVPEEQILGRIEQLLPRLGDLGL